MCVCVFRENFKNEFDYYYNVLTRMVRFYYKESDDDEELKERRKRMIKHFSFNFTLP